MDVRCDRCQTEYELDDDSVAERGASVQCTTCGHTFVVSRQKRDVTPTPGPTTEMAAPAWVLTTEEGKVHRFRDPTTLQKWIVERRVGRADRVAPPGASTRRLGDMDELRPFFDLVDQADRAASARVARPTQPETPQRISVAAQRGYVSPDEDDDDVLMSGRQSRGGGQRGRGGYSGRLDSDIAAGLSGMGVDDTIGSVLPRRNFGKWVLAGLVIAGGMVGAWHLGKGRPAPEVASAPVAAPAASPAVAPVAVPTPPAAPPVAAPVPSPPPVAAPAPAAAPAAAARIPAPPDDVPPEPLPPARPSARGPAAAPEPAGRPRGGYEQLVAEADRALEHGNTAKAQKLIDEALRLQPSGVAAVTTSAYVMLDKQKPLAAAGEFKRALNLSPNFAPALFGLGEAYRAAGNTAQAIDSYKRYLASSPAGADAPAAQRQIRELESQPARPSHSATANVPAPGGTPPPMPEPAPPP